MGPIRGIKKKRKLEKKDEEKSLLSGPSIDLLSKAVAGNPLSFSLSRGLDEFKSTFGMSKKTFGYICSLVEEHMMIKTHFTFADGTRMSLTDQVALALRRLGSGNSLISIGDSFGAHHSTVSQVTWRFIEAIEENGLRHLQWPSTEREMHKIKHKFEKIQGLPNCCGAVDTTHVTMQLTASDQEATHWLDREKNHSMILQAIVDPDLKFRDVVAGYPGKLSDSSVLQSSSFFRRCQEGAKLNGSSTSTGIREYVVGDSGFPLLPWLITPYQGNALSETKLGFNRRLVATHLVARKAMARLKEAWRIIRGDLWRPDKHKLPRFLLVCCILHNIVIDMEDRDVEETPTQHDPGYRHQICDSADEEGLAVRDKLMRVFSGKTVLQLL